MRLLSRFALLTIAILLFFISTKTANAVTCESVSITPESGDINTEFVFTATGCVDEADDTFPPDLRVEYENTATGFWSSVTPTRLAGDPYSLTANIGGFIDPGPYVIGIVQYSGQTPEKIVGSPLNFTVDPPEGDSNPPGDPVIACGNICDPTNTCSLCPTWCDAARVTNDQGVVEWRCSVDNPVICGGADGAGIDSAIGCIPFEDVNQTTQFFIRWALGVGGGIALFLIALSGIKIATTKGDPKRLQDARDTFSSAIAGLIMIVLSVFVMRFLSETLLDLF